MDKGTITKLNQSFEEHAYLQDSIEYWLARELMELLGYAEWRNFLNAVEKAKESCKSIGESVSDHFVDVNKTIPMPKETRHLQALESRRDKIFIEKTNNLNLKSHRDDIFIETMHLQAIESRSDVIFDLI